MRVNSDNRKSRPNNEGLSIAEIRAREEARRLKQAAP